jgi:hypothetical protein
LDPGAQPRLYKSERSDGYFDHTAAERSKNAFFFDAQLTPEFISASSIHFSDPGEALVLK